MSAKSVYRHKRKGIADILAVLIAIAITVVAGVALYGLVMGKISVFGNSPNLNVQNAQITNGIVVIQVQNTGTYTFTSLSFTIYYQGNALGSATSFSLPSNGLAPGQTVSYTGSFSSITGTNEVVGGVYTIVISGTYNNGQTFTTSVTVIGS